MKVFITGGQGLVGRNVIERLTSVHEIISPKRSDLDLFATADVETLVRREAPDIVIHCAGTVGGIQANIREPARFLVENFELGKNVVLAAAAASVPRLINLGSSCMYPRSAPNPLREELILQGELEPTNEGYAIAKIAIQRLCAYLSAERSELAYKTVIPCNLYGKWDKFDTARSHMIPSVIRKLHEAKIEGKESIDVWGKGLARREFMYAGDLADFIAYALEHFDAMPNLLNVGLGYDYSIDEYYQTIASVVGYTGFFKHDISKPQGMEQKLVDIRKMESFGWEAHTSLKEGLCLTYKYFLEKDNYL